MGIPSGSTRYALQFSLAGGEFGETSIWCTGADIASESDAAACAESVWGHWQDSMDTLLPSLIPAGGKWTQCTAYHYTGGSSAAYIGMFVENVSGTGGTKLPYQTCAVVTLQTGLAGRRNRGRCYLPAMGLDGSTGTNQLVSATVDALADNFGAFLSALNSESSPDVGSPVVVSRSATAIHPITQVRVDSRFDVQRRRANHQAALFTATAAVSI